MTDSASMKTAKKFQFIPEGWWQIVLVGMSGISDDALKAWRNSARTKDGKPRYNADRHKVKSGEFDSAIRAGRREREYIERNALSEYEFKHRLRAREMELSLWMASFSDVPCLVRPAFHDWYLEFEPLKAIVALGVTPNCWEYDDSGMDAVPMPRLTRSVAGLEAA